MNPIPLSASFYGIMPTRPDLISSDASAINCPNGAIRVTEHDSLERALKMTCILQQQSKRGTDSSDAIKVVSAVCDSDKGNSSRKGNRPPSLPASTLLRKTNSDREGGFQL